MQVSEHTKNTPIETTCPHCLQVWSIAESKLESCNACGYANIEEDEERHYIPGEDDFDYDDECFYKDDLIGYEDEEI